MLQRNDGEGQRLSPIYFLFICGLLLGIGAILLLAQAAPKAGEDAPNRSGVPAGVPTLASVAQVETVRSTPAQPTLMPVLSPTYVPTSVPSATIAPEQPTSPVAPVTPAPMETPAPLQLSAGTRIQVTYDGGEGLHLRDGPHQNKVATLLKGSSLTVRGEAVDDGGFRWWPVTMESGWLAEGPSDTTQPRWLTSPLTTPIRNW